MDRLTGDLEMQSEDGQMSDIPAIPLSNAEEGLLRQSAARLALPERLFALDELDVLYDASQRAIWTFMHPAGRPSFTPPMLSDFENWQQLIVQSFGPDKVPLDYLILGSRAPGVFCFGGDLQLFADLIQMRTNVITFVSSDESSVSEHRGVCH